MGPIWGSAVGGASLWASKVLNSVLSSKIRAFSSFAYLFLGYGMLQFTFSFLCQYCPLLDEIKTAHLCPAWHAWRMKHHLLSLLSGASSVPTFHRSTKWSGHPDVSSRTAPCLLLSSHECWQFGLREELYLFLRSRIALVQWGEWLSTAWSEIWQVGLRGLSQRLQMKPVLGGQVWKMTAAESSANWWGSWMLSSTAALLFGSRQGLLGEMSQSLGRANAVLM